ncbi:MAG: hypothetical protein HQK56_21160, partial [Deltaproteobacteria bacterium]|nr:hypothetical protein [Deltaproteobacteria bacterium]
PSGTSADRSTTGFGVSDIFSVDTTDTTTTTTSTTTTSTTTSTTTTTSATTTTLPGQAKQKAIIVAGGPMTDSMWPTFENNANKAYKTLIVQGVTNNNIWYLSANKTGDHVDDIATSGHVADALSGFAAKGAKRGDGLILYLIGHGNEAKIKLSDTDFLTAAALKASLDDLQNTTHCWVIVVIES